MKAQRNLLRALALSLFTVSSSFTNLVQVCQRSNKCSLDTSCILHGRILYSKPVDSYEENSSTSNVKGTAVKNKNAQEAFTLISKRCNENIHDGEWKKTKRYIYHATSPTSTKNFLTLEQIKSVLDFLGDLFNEKDLEYKASGSDVTMAYILQSIPRILRKDPENFLRPTVDFLKGLYGPMFYEFVGRRPEILLTSGVGYNAKVDTMKTNSNKNGVEKGSVATLLSSDKICLTNAQIEKIKKSHPVVFQQSLDKVTENVHFLTELCAPSKIKLVGRIIQSNPNILNLALSNLESKISFLRDECGFDSDDSLMLLLKKYPGILCLSLVDNLRPSIEIISALMQSDDGKSIATRENLVKCLTSHPQILALSPKNISKKAAYFHELGSIARQKSKAKSSPSLTTKILLTCPSVFSLSFSNIQEKVDFLTKVWESKIQSEEKTKIVAKRLYEYPTVLTLSLDGNISPTVAFYDRAGYISLELDDKGADSEHLSYLPPRYLATSLYNRLLPRWHFYTKQESDIENSKKPPLHLLAGTSDENFCAKMNYSLNDYMSFKEEAIPRLKFSSQFDTWIKTGRPIDIG